MISSSLKDSRAILAAIEASFRYLFPELLTMVWRAEAAWRIALSMFSSSAFFPTSSIELAIFITVFWRFSFMLRQPFPEA